MWDLIGSYVGALLTTLTGILFVKYILRKKININVLIVIFIILFNSVLAMFLYLNYSSFVRTVFSCLLFLILYKSSFKLSFFESLLYSIIYLLLLTVSEISVFLILTEVLHVESVFLYETFALSFMSNFVISIFALIIGFIIRRWLFKLSNVKIRNEFVFYTLLLFVCIMFFFYITFINIGNGLSLFSGIMVIIVMICVLANLLVQSYRNNKLTIKYDKLLEFIKKYEVEIDNQRTMRHEIKNQLLTIKSKIIDKDKNSNIINYIDEILEDNSKVINHTEYAKLNYLPPNGIKGLFYFKVSEAFDKNIDVNINISREIEKSVLSNLNSVMFNQVGKLFGILLDNAIEAAEIANDKKIGIEIYVINNEVNFIVSNTYVGDVLSSRGIFPITTKGESRGHGLLLARAIIGSSNKFKLETTITDELYIQKLIIK